MRQTYYTQKKKKKSQCEVCFKERSYWELSVVMELELATLW